MIPALPILQLRILVHHDGTRILQWANGGFEGWQNVSVVHLPKPVSNLDLDTEPGDGA